MKTIGNTVGTASGVEKFSVIEADIHEYMKNSKISKKETAFWNLVCWGHVKSIDRIAQEIDKRRFLLNHEVSSALIKRLFFYFFQWSKYQKPLDELMEKYDFVKGLYLNMDRLNLCYVD
ncbi:MAG: hypothetical protein H6791_00955 [Candidatus Nomurabacteria bacterium]|nr:MAG: hypothetical protein H6791_00955 [Candidatus Nomurabacteria bacterium]